MPTEAMHRLNVTILDGSNQLTHWRGSPSVDGGALMGIDVSPVGGPPHFEYGTTDREQMKITLETVILGADEAEQNAFIKKYSRGTVFSAPQISGISGIAGLPDDVLALDWVVENHRVRHNATGNDPSVLEITLAELGPTA